ncbi:MAG: hypothetical protein ABFR32_09850 [Bacteroidota bacterium]
MIFGIQPERSSFLLWFYYDFLDDMKTINSQILELPDEQSKWLLSVKKIFRTAIHNNSINVKELIIAIEGRAVEKGFLDIGMLLDSNDIEEYFRS